MDFPRRCLQSCRRSRDHSVLEKKKTHKRRAKCLRRLTADPQDITNPWNCSIKNVPVLFYRSSGSIFCMLVLCCWRREAFFFFFACLFVCLLLLEEKLLWLTFRGALFMKHNHYIPYPSPPATSAPDSLWTSICVWGNTMDKRSIQHRLKSSHLAAPFSKTLHRLTQSGEQRVCLRGKCRCVPRTRNRNQVISVSKLGYFLDIYTGKKTPALICD